MRPVIFIHPDEADLYIRSGDMVQTDDGMVCGGFLVRTDPPATTPPYLDLNRLYQDALARKASSEKVGK